MYIIKNNKFNWYVEDFGDNYLYFTNKKEKAKKYKTMEKIEKAILVLKKRFTLKSGIEIEKLESNENNNKGI